jgi:cyclopropane fatty-acyl-phospholipid synthase-like methyltransferase
MAAIGKTVIHPGGRRSTAELISLADFAPNQEVLDVGCGVGTTALLLAKRFGCRVTAVDIDPRMVEQTKTRVAAAGLNEQIQVDRADIQALPYSAASFDRVVVEAVTMFVDRARAASEIVRVCRPGGRVLEHEFIYRRPPTPDVRQIFEGEVCPGIRFDSVDDWCQLFAAAGLVNLRHVSGSFVMMSIAGMWRDEGPKNLGRMMLTLGTRPAYIRKMAWLLPRILRVRSYLGYVVLAGTRPATANERYS